MAVPSYWNTGFKFSPVAATNDTANWLTAVRTMLTSTLAVADRWVESPTNTYTSPADSVSGNQIKLVVSSPAANRFLVTFSQIVLGVTTTVFAGESDITGSPTAVIMAGPKHIWFEAGAVPTWWGGCMADPTPEAQSGFAASVLCFTKLSAGGGGLFQNQEYWFAVDGQTGSQCPRLCPPFFVANVGSEELTTAGGSFVYFPIGMCIFPVTSGVAAKFVGTMTQFVCVNNSFVAGNLVSVPIDVGVLGVFYVCSGTAFAAGNGGRFAVRVA